MHDMVFQPSTLSLRMHLAFEVVVTRRTVRITDPVLDPDVAFVADDGISFGR